MLPVSKELMEISLPLRNDLHKHTQTRAAGGFIFRQIGTNESMFCDNGAADRDI